MKKRKPKETNSRRIKAKSDEIRYDSIKHVQYVLIQINVENNNRTIEDFFQTQIRRLRLVHTSIARTTAVVGLLHGLLQEIQPVPTWGSQNLKLQNSRSGSVHAWDIIKTISRLLPLRNKITGGSEKQRQYLNCFPAEWSYMAWPGQPTPPRPTHPHHSPNYFTVIFYHALSVAHTNTEWARQREMPCTKVRQ